MPVRRGRQRNAACGYANTTARIAASGYNGRRKFHSVRRLSAHTPDATDAVRRRRTMKHLILTLALAGGALTLTPAAARAQIGSPLYRQKAAERQVIGWFQGYLGRLPNAQELAILANKEFYARSGNTPAGFINRLFLLTMGRQATLTELAGLQNQVIFNGRLWFVQTYLSQIAGGW